MSIGDIGCREESVRSSVHMYLLIHSTQELNGYNEMIQIMLNASPLHQPLVNAFHKSVTKLLTVYSVNNKFFCEERVRFSKGIILHS